MMRNSCAIRRRAILFCLVSAASLAPIADADAQAAEKAGAPIAWGGIARMPIEPA